VLAQPRDALPQIGAEQAGDCFLVHGDVGRRHQRCAAGTPLAPAPAGTRMRWSGQVQPKGAFRLLGPVITRLGIRQEERIWTSLKKHLEAAPPE
jgi:hypothetical protein